MLAEVKGQLAGTGSLLYCVGPRDQIQVNRLDNKVPLPTEPSPCTPKPTFVLCV